MTEARIAALEARLRELEDREAMSGLTHRYALCIRQRDKAACQALLMPDAWFELRHIDPANPASDSLVTRLEGSAAMIGGYDTEAGAAQSVWPMLHNIEISLNGDMARSICVMHRQSGQLASNSLVNTMTSRFTRQKAGDLRPEPID